MCKDSKEDEGGKAAEEVENLKPPPTATATRPDSTTPRLHSAAAGTVTLSCQTGQNRSSQLANMSQARRGIEKRVPHLHLSVVSTRVSTCNEGLWCR